MKYFIAAPRLLFVLVLFFVLGDMVYAQPEIASYLRKCGECSNSTPWELKCSTIVYKTLHSVANPCSLKVCIKTKICDGVKFVHVMSINAEDYCSAINAGSNELLQDILYNVLNSLIHQDDPFDILPSNGSPVKLQIYSAVCWGPAYCNYGNLLRQIFVPCRIEACCETTIDGNRDECGRVVGFFNKALHSNKECPQNATLSIFDELELDYQDVNNAKFNEYFYPCNSAPVFVSGACVYSCGFTSSGQHGFVRNNQLVPVQ